jgi:iron complex transport system ATP-binding protein
VNSDDALQCSGVAVRYGVHHVLRDVSLSIQAGECVALVGRNGAGKSTFLRVLAGAQTPDTGLVKWSGVDASAVTPREAAQRVSWLSQSTEGAEAFTALQVVSFGLFASQSPWASLGESDWQRCREALQALGVGALADRRVGELSGGERQRVRFAMAMAQRTPVALFDEPTSAQDLDGSRLMLGALHARARSGDAVVVAVHDLSLALQAFGRVVVLHEASVAFDGPPREVVESGILSSVFGNSVHTSVDSDGRLWAGVQLDGLDQS